MSRFAVHFCAMNRKYELKERARRQAETRQRIVEAAVDLHTSVGPARTTISGIAERAGVERHTVYAHFPDEPRSSRHVPSTGPVGIRCRTSRRWPRSRTRCAAFAARSARCTRGTSPSRPIWRCSFATPPPSRRRSPAGGCLTSRRWPTPSHSAGRAARASERRSGTLEFETWRSLVRRQGLSRTQAVDAMTRLVSSV